LSPGTFVANKRSNKARHLGSRSTGVRQAIDVRDQPFGSKASRAAIAGFHINRTRAGTQAVRVANRARWEKNRARGWKEYDTFPRAVCGGGLTTILRKEASFSGSRYGFRLDRGKHGLAVGRPGLVVRGSPHEGEMDRWTLISFGGILWGQLLSWLHAVFGETPHRDRVSLLLTALSRTVAARAPVCWSTAELVTTEDKARPQGRLLPPPLWPNYLFSNSSSPSGRPRWRQAPCPRFSPSSVRLPPIDPLRHRFAPCGCRRAASLRICWHAALATTFAFHRASGKPKHPRLKSNLGPIMGPNGEARRVGWLGPTQPPAGRFWQFHTSLVLLPLWRFPRKASFPSSSGRPAPRLDARPRCGRSLPAN